MPSLVGSEMCIRDRYMGIFNRELSQKPNQRIFKTTMASDEKRRVAQAAYKNNDPEASKQAHLTEGLLRAPEKHKSAGEVVKSLVYGGLDGILTVFTAVTGSEGASLSLGLVLIFGISTLGADAIAMAVGDYLGSRSEYEFNCSERRREEWEMENNPEGEILEMQELYVERGMDAEDAKVFCNTLAKYPKVWLDIMMVEELGILEGEDDSLRNGIVTFFSFAFFGSIPLVAYVVAYIIEWKGNLFLVSCILTGLTMVLLGVVKSFVAHISIYRAVIETVVVGVVAAVAGYFVGWEIDRCINGGCFQGQLGKRILYVAAHFYAFIQSSCVRPSGITSSLIAKRISFFHHLEKKKS
eukprot:TRINITY_DN9116_c0_g1_i1.p1 TRINITY_DN9116_c0_g1~~TRINITY_DN9116_c0_g1_i1.p1  ORF type:complete len:354 (-),score=79.24 TRINITY_DN9116_c0_g1_i1:195-1256(-)